MEYHFTDEEGFQKLLGAGSVIEARAYHTRLGLWRYFTVADERVDLEAYDFSHSAKYLLPIIVSPLIMPHFCRNFKSFMQIP